MRTRPILILILSICFTLISSAQTPQKTLVEKIQITKPKRTDSKPGYSASKSTVEEPLQVQKELYIPQRSYNIVTIQRKALKEVGASETAIQNATDTPAQGQFD